jgi:hypothetical protein
MVRAATANVIHSSQQIYRFVQHTCLKKRETKDLEERWNASNAAAENGMRRIFVKETVELLQN